MARQRVQEGARRARSRAATPPEPTKAEAPEVETAEALAEERGDGDPAPAVVFAARLSRAAEELKETLAIEEGAFRLLAPQAHPSSREYFLFEALDELQKTTVAVLCCEEALSGETESSVPLTRIIAESIAEWLALCQRRLIETLADLLCFSTSEEEPYFRDYLLHTQLAQALAAQRDRERFYGAESRNFAHQVAELGAEIEALEREGLEPEHAWYRYRRSAFRAEGLAVGRVLASASRRIELALSLAEPSERASLGFSYGRGFGGRSNQVHARPGGFEPVLDPQSVAGELGAIAAIGLSVLIRCQKLAGVVPEGVNEWFRKLEDENDFAREFVGVRMRGKACPGDVVLAGKELAQVLEVAEGKSGYRSYFVRYLSRPPLPEIVEDWHLAEEVRVVLDVPRARAMVAARAAEPDPAKLCELDDQALMAAMGESIAAVEAGGAGMREAILAEAARRRPREDQGRAGVPTSRDAGGPGGVSL